MYRKAVTVKDIANKLQVSLSTVNKALTGKPGISESRRAEILSVAREMGYTVNYAAQALSRRRKTIGIVFPSLWQSFWADVNAGMQEELEKLQQFHVSGEFRYVATPQQAKEAIETFIAQKVDLLIFSSALFTLQQECFDALNNCCIPVFLLGSRLESVNARCCIGVNGKVAGGLAADIMSLRLSSGDAVAIFTGTTKINIHEEKVRAFQASIQQRGYRVAAIYETQDDEKIVDACVSKLYRDHPEIKGIYITTASGIGLFNYVRTLPAMQRPLIVATDVYEQLRQAIHENIVTATIYQNQRLMGRLSIKKAYHYLLSTTSYMAHDFVVDMEVFVTPKVLFKTNFAFETEECCKFV